MKKFQQLVDLANTKRRQFDEYRKEVNSFSHELVFGFCKHIDGIPGSVMF